jgi:carbamoyl-phosphate synthase small subunit
VFPPASLVLADGSVHRGFAFGSAAGGIGEVVFNTSMTGYQEVLTDPSYAGQLVTLTYPLVGNYGINDLDFESRRIQVSGLVVREHCDSPSHGSSVRTIHEFLHSQGIPGISGVDTRAITRRLRSGGVMMGAIASGPDIAMARLKQAPNYGEVDHVRSVSTATAYCWDETRQNSAERPYRVLVTDCGLKYNILRELTRRGCQVQVMPADIPAEDLLSLSPSGVLLSPGPGDPQLLDYVVDNARQILGRVPVMGICLGHQIVARALGADTYKLKFGHRGGNHPVRDLSDGRIYITAQNHGYAVRADSLPAGLEVSHINLNDETVEGLTHRELPLFTIQYHSEASPGPLDNEYLFDRFLKLMDDFRA